MDDPLIDRRAEPRLPAEVLRMPQATLRPGCPVDVIDLSPQGIQVQSLRPLRPGSRVLARVVVGDQTVTLPATVFWCLVWTVHLDEGVTYRGGLRFEEVCLPVWEEWRAGRICFMRRRDARNPVSAVDEPASTIGPPTDATFAPTINHVRRARAVHGLRLLIVARPDTHAT